MIRLVNNYMELELIATIGDNALLKRLNDSSYVVCNGINIHNDFTCDWAFAYGYYESYDSAYKCFIDKVVKPFMEYDQETQNYAEMVQFVQWILDQWEIDTKEAQDKALKLIGASEVEHAI